MKTKINISSILIEGNWKKGWALDYYSQKNESGEDYEHTPLGELLHQCKYENSLEALKPLSDLVIRFLSRKFFILNLTAIIPAPPSDLSREFQPVEELCKILSRKLNLELPTDYLIKIRPTQPIKFEYDRDDRFGQFKDIFRVKDFRYAGKKILIFDDFFRSGSTLFHITDTLYNQGKVKNVYVMVLAKTGGNN